ncbi:MAG: MBL fold metallo-hydrolase [Armatimonadota bacterium]|nr:MBL fold metallo-hydrolase [Armatimonadota bacterium]MDR7485937.1 MBL fold metallo-hydrolase [Armatimonadota bacterium]MDR7533829.1 MBL fold metallo-hydrolase [Armatimonadota bacterium]MDR7536642.1 MBL fold metallo-hydrolase [Armatimonadota bacterium]
MRVTLWGTRGSLPSPGPETQRYGGNTPCVEARCADGTLVILDGGTGIRRLGAVLSPEIARVDILLTHLHMDHIQGLGFFAPLYRPGLDVHIWGPASPTRGLRARLAQYLSPPLFPVQIRDLPCRLAFHDVPFEPFRLGRLEVRAALVCHPGPTVGYRITEDRTVLAYLPDHEPALGARRFPGAPNWTSGFALAAGADLLIHDAQFSDEEYTRHIGWGHSAIGHVAAFADLAGARRVVPFHHDPAHADDVVDALHAQLRGRASSFEVVAGMEGTTVEVGRPRAA